MNYNTNFNLIGRRMPAFRVALAITAVAIASAQAQPTADSLEALAGPGTYLDLTDNPAGIMRNGVTMTWDNFAAGAWNFPDTSNGSEFVNGNSADDKEAPGGTAPILLNLSGLSPFTDYNILLGVLARPPGNDEGGDISWGIASDSLTTVTFDNATVPPGSFVVEDGTTLALVRVGSLSSDGSGSMAFYVGEGLPFQDDPIRNRTQFDGVFLSVVPEPSAGALLALGSLGTLFLRRRRA